MLTGMPLDIVLMNVACQPPIIAVSTGLALEPNFRPLP